MNFEYSCFISYRHDQGEVFDTFMDQFLKALQSELKMLLDIDIFKDREKLITGSILDKNLAKALCKSVCMIFIYTPKYFNREKTYCAREFLLMKNIEKNRFSKVAKPQLNSFIMPVVLRGKDNFPSAIFENEPIYADFEKFTLVDSREISRNPDFYPEIQNIAKQIQARHSEFSDTDPDDDCNNLEFADENTVKSWLNTVVIAKQKMPFR